MNKMSFFIQRLIRLCYMVIIFFIRSHVNYFICYSRVLWICLINTTIRSFHKTIFINSRIRCKRVDQTDVWSLRSLDRTHSSVMRIMYVSNFKSGTITGQTSRTQCRKTSLMSKLTQRVVLIHKLRQLGRTKEFFHCCCNRFDIDQRLRRNSLRILSCHSFSYNSFQSGHTDTILILQQFTNCTDTTVTQMVDIIIISQTILQMHIIVNRSKNIFFCNMFRNQLMHMMTNCFFQIFFILMFFHKLRQSRIIYQFCNSQFFWFTIHKTGKIHHHIRKNFDISLFCLDPYKRNCRILNRICQFFCNLCSCFCQNLSCCCVNHILSQNLSGNTVSQKQLFIKFISSYFRQIITFRIKEHTVDQAASAFHCQRLTWTNLLIQFQKTFLITGGSIFPKTCQNLRFFTEQIYDLCICSLS